MTKRGPQSYSYYETIDACGEPGCPLCRLGQASANRHLTSLIYDSVNDVSLRETLRNSLGYCKEHAWLLPNAGDSAPLGIAVVHRDLVNTIYRRLGAIDYGKSAGGRLRSAITAAVGLEGKLQREGERAPYLPQKAQCPACERRDEAEKLALKSLSEALSRADEGMIAALKDSDGLCLLHLRLALESARNQEGFKLLISLTQTQLEALLHDLDEFIRKSDHRFRDERVNERERDSWRRALQRFAGPETKL